MSKKIAEIKDVLRFMEIQFGDENVIEIISTQQMGKDIKVVWKEVGDEEENFSIVGYGRYGYLTEKIGG